MLGLGSGIGLVGRPSILLMSTNFFMEVFSAAWSSAAAVTALAATQLGGDCNGEPSRSGLSRQQLSSSPFVLLSGRVAWFLAGNHAAGSVPHPVALTGGKVLWGVLHCPLSLSPRVLLLSVGDNVLLLYFGSR